MSCLPEVDALAVGTLGAGCENSVGEGSVEGTGLLPDMDRNRALGELEVEKPVEILLVIGPGGPSIGVVVVGLDRIREWGWKRIY